MSDSSKEPDLSNSCHTLIESLPGENEQSLSFFIHLTLSKVQTAKQRAIP